MTIPRASDYMADWVINPTTPPLPPATLPIPIQRVGAVGVESADQDVAQTPAPSATAISSPTRPPVCSGLPAPMGLQGWVYDLEVYPGFFLALFYNGTEWRRFTHLDIPALIDFISDPGKALIGFNSSAYDDAILRLILRSPDIITDDIVTCSSLLIDNEQRFQVTELLYGWKSWGCSVDVFALVNKKTSLKEWACKIGSENIADSPVSFNQVPPPEAIPDIERYCRNDVLVTAELYHRYYDRVELREVLMHDNGLDVRVFSQSEAQLGEYTVLTRLSRETGISTKELRLAAQSQPVVTEFAVADLLVPMIAFKTAPYQACLETIRKGWVSRMKEAKLHTAWPRNQIALDGVTYQLGLGGIHSSDEPLVCRADEDTALVDFDVTSFYPAIIIALGIRPDHIPAEFTAILDDIRCKRVEAKRNKNKVVAQAMKIVINAVFGKSNSPYSALYGPRCTYTVTILGQMLLLMLIEELTLAGATVISANTDGVLVRYRRDRETAIMDAKSAWEQRTQLSLESTPYRFYARTSVNDFIAANADNADVKRKGVFAYDDEGKADGVVVAKALEAYFLHRVDPEEFIQHHNVAADFMYYQRAKDKMVFKADGQELPKTIRWYAATQGVKLIRTGGKSGPTSLPNGDRARLALTLPGSHASALADLDREHYVAEVRDVITKIRGG